MRIISNFVRYNIEIILINYWNNHFMPKLKTCIFIVFTILYFYNVVNCQTFTERLILDYPKDSIFLNTHTRSFDKEGNYCFEISKNLKAYLYTNKDTIGPYDYITGTSGSGPIIDHTENDKKTDDMPWYIKTSIGANVYGPIKGENEHWNNSDTKENLALTVKYKDSIYYYINDRLISKIQKDKVVGVESYDWCAFNENGNVLYNIKKDDKYFLYLNDKIIGKSPEYYNQLAINNSGKYIYGEGRIPKEKSSKFDYMYFIHTADTAFGPVRTLWECDLKQNGGYYYSGDNNGTSYIVINNAFYKDIDSIGNITIFDDKNSMFTYKENKVWKINVNGKIIINPYQYIYYPSFDGNGNYAFYGLKDYYIYKSINGVQSTEPITKYNVRPIPLYIIPTGKSLHYFTTNDSTYIYQDDNLLFPAFSNKIDFKIQSFNKLVFQQRKRGIADKGISLFYMQIGTTGYFVYNGELSKPMIPALGNSFHIGRNLGEIVAGKFNETGFFVIQQISTFKYLININNKVYKELDGMDDIIENSCEFDGNELVFTGIKDKSFYLYHLKQ